MAKKDKASLAAPVCRTYLLHFIAYRMNKNWRKRYFFPLSNWSKRLLSSFGSFVHLCISDRTVAAYQLVEWWEQKRGVFNKIYIVFLLLLLILGWGPVTALWNYRVGIAWVVLSFLVSNIIFLVGWVFEVFLFYYFNRIILNVWLRFSLFAALVAFSAFFAAFVMFESFAIIFPIE